MRLEKIARNIEKEEDGIYYSKSGSKVSYPDEGNDYCMQLEDTSFWFLHRNNIIAESVKKYSADKTFYDIGGGNGFVAKRLQDDGVKVVLVEPGKVGAKNAYQRGIKNVLCSTLEDAGFAAGAIESVGLFDVVEHIEDDLTFLKNIHNYMKEEGFIYINVPAYNFLWSKEDEDAGHFKRYSRTQLNDLLQKAGFEIIYSTYVFSILPPAIFFFRSLPSKLGFNKNSQKLEKHQSVHKLPEKLDNLFQKLWNWELSRIKNDKKILTGSSCFVIGKKVADNT